MAYLSDEERRSPASAEPPALLHEVEHWGMLAQAKEAALTLPQVWNFTAGGGSIIGGPAPLGKGVVFGSCDSKLYALDPAGALRWSFAASAPILCTPLVTSDGIFFGSQDGRFYCVGLDGSHRWTAAVKGPVFGQPAALDDLVFFGTKSGTVYALDTSGKRRWTFPTQGPVTASPALADGAVVVASWDRSVYALEPATGNELWRFKSSGLVPNLAAANDLVVFGSYDRTCTAVSNGRLSWRASLGGPVFAAPVLLGNRTFIPCLDKSLYALESGSVSWRWESSDLLDSTPALADRTLLVGSNDHSLTALTLSGSAIWKAMSNGPFLATKPLAHEGSVYAGCYDCSLHAFDLPTGRKRWQFRTSTGHAAHIEVSVPNAPAFQPSRFFSQELSRSAEERSETGSGGYRSLLGSKDMGVYAAAETEHPLHQYSAASISGPEDHHGPRKKKKYAEC